MLCNIVWTIRDNWLGWESFRIRDEHFQTDHRPGPNVVTGPQKEFPTLEALYEHLAEIWMKSSILLNRLCGEKGMHYYQRPDRKPGTGVLVGWVE